MDAPESKSLSGTARRVLTRLRREYGPPRAFLRHETPFQLLVAVILSAQSADAGVNKVTPALFAKYPTPEAMARARVDVLRRILEPGVQYAWTKAPRLKETARRIVEDFGGEVPRSLDDLTSLPGVGRKTASVVQGYLWGEADTVAVDTHVKRVTYRLGLTSRDDAKVAERELSALVPRRDWPDVNFYCIAHGRATCRAVRPACGRCVLSDLCPKVGVTETAPPPKA
ncbi:MAG TPA: endonuclease III [Candidatus Thermoplasmatota archaeon]|nr:endonuclease III [Candidatus Thermoplasmatota archaeon]